MKLSLLAISLCLTGSASAVLLTGCRGETTHETPFVGIRNMYNQPKSKIQGESAFFEDHRDMRPPVEGAVSREAEIDDRIGKGLLEDNSGYVLTVPNEVIEKAGGMDPLVHRGQDRFGIYCTPCHDKTGSGNGMVVKRGMLKPPSLHEERIRHLPDGQIFATISNGIRNMPAYAPQIPVSDRWAIVSYVRALELSQAQAASEKKP